MELDERIRDVFLLRDAEQRSERLDDEARARARRALALSRQRARAASCLWTTGSRVEALALQRLALAAMLEARAAAAPALQGDEDAEVEVGTGDPRWPAEVALDAEVTSEQASVFKEADRERERLDRAVARVSMSRDGYALQRQVRVGGTALAVLALVLAFGWAATRPGRAIARGDAYPGFAPERAVDDDKNTEWLTPHMKPGKLVLSFTKPRDVSRVRVVNAHNPPYADRAAKVLRVALLRGGKTVAEKEATFEALETTREWTTIDVAAPGVDEAILEVKSFHGKGGGLAEVVFE